MQEPYAEDAVFDVSAVFTDVAPMQGHQNMRRYWSELRETWAGLRLDPLEVLDVGDGRYVIDLRLWGKGKRSGVEVEQRLAFLHTMRPGDGKVVHTNCFRMLQRRFPRRSRPPLARNSITSSGGGHDGWSAAPPAEPAAGGWETDPHPA